MKKIILALMFILFATFSFAQTAYVTPQTIAWDAPVDIPKVGITEYEVFLIRIYDGTKVLSEVKSRSSDYILLGKVPKLSMVVDLQTTKLVGDFVVAVRTTFTYNEILSVSDFAYSDVDTDVYPKGETFFLRYLGGLDVNKVNKPTMIRFEGVK